MYFMIEVGMMVRVAIRQSRSDIDSLISRKYNNGKTPRQAASSLGIRSVGHPMNLAAERVLGPNAANKKGQIFQ
jgi:hypothetical protein